MEGKEFAGSVSEEDDEWYCKSIKRYDELIMFDLEDKVVSFDLLDSASICLLCKKASGAQVMLQQSLPLKLSIKPKGENKKIKDTDMKIKSGVFPDTFVLQMSSLYGEDKLITSEEDVSGVKIYQLGSTAIDQTKKYITISAPLLEPRISIIDRKLVFLARDTSTESCILDLSTGELKYCINCVSDIQNTLIPVTLSQNTLALCKESNGEVFIYDTRSGAGKWDIKGHEDSSKYSICSTFDYTNPSSHQSIIGTIGTNGLYSFYDLRNSHQILSSGQLNLGCDDKTDLKMKFSPSGKKVSLSGHNGNVIVYSFIKNDLEEIFCHDGHEHMEHISKNTTVTDHLWYEERCIISSADNHSLNCWQYIVAED